MRETVATDWYHTKVDWTKSVDFPMENEIEVMMNNVVLSLKEIINNLNDLNLYWNSDDIKKQINKIIGNK